MFTSNSPRYRPRFFHPRDWDDSFFDTEHAAGGLWDQRNNTSLFASFGSFAGDKTGGCGSGTIGCDTNAANTPWGWDDSNDGPARGTLATDPAGLANNYFHIPEGISTAYTFNPYR